MPGTSVAGADFMHDLDASGGFPCQDVSTVGKRAGIVVTGTEVLTGRVADANGPWLAERLRVSVRALREACRSELESTPTAVVKERRLLAARARLRRAVVTQLRREQARLA